MTKKKKKSGRQETLPVKDHDTKIKYILDHFNFIKVQDAMIALNWKWQHLNDPEDQTSRVPTIERMKETAHYLLFKAATDKERYWATGGFQSIRYMDGDIELKFVVAEYGSHE
jgi:hypothetical protein